MTLYTADVRRAAFVIIDMQDFSCRPTTGEPMPGLTRVIERINSLARACRNSAVPVIWVRHSVSSESGAGDGGLYPLFHTEAQTRAIMDRGEGTRICSEMDFDPAHDLVTFKNRYSAFLSNPSELQRKLQALGRSQLIMAGIAANVCVESTLRDAMQLDYEVILVADGTTAPDAMLLKGTLDNTRRYFGDVQTAQQVMDALGHTC